MPYGLAALLASSLVVALTGGGRFVIDGLTISMRDWRRPIAIWSLLLLARLVWLWRRHASADGAQRLADETSTIGLWALLLLGPALWLHYLVVACGGLDSHGYVSAADLLTNGRLHAPQATQWLPLDRPIDALAPLGYISSQDGRAIVPEFPLGLPLVMALFQLAFGTSGPFYVSPLLGAGTVALTFVLMRRVSTPLAAAFAGAVIAVHPLFFTYAIQPMSDVTATFWLVLAVTLLSGHHPRPLAAGMAAGLALMTRPPLGLPALVLPFLPLFRSGAGVVARYFVGLVAWLIVLMALQWAMFGSPFTSGHGAASVVFSFDALPHNLWAHAKWLLFLHTPMLLLALAAAWRFGNRRFLVAALIVFLAVSAPYMLYRVPFDDWEMLRFLLPGLVFLLMAASDGTVRVCERFLPRAAVPMTVLAVAVAIGVSSHRYLQERQVFRLAAAESKYPAVAAWFSENSTPDDVVLASLHSGSVRHYSGRLTLRWDRIPSERMADVVDAISDRGGSAFLVLDGGAERQQFADRFGAGGPDGLRIEFVDRIRTVDIGRVILY